MVPARNMMRALVTLLLSATRLQAFNLHTVVTSAAASRGCREVSRAVQHHPSTKTSAKAVPSWTRAGRRAGSVTVGMSADAVAMSGVMITDLQDREYQLEELEDRDVAETSLVLNKDGTITAGATNGPIPINVRGKWSFDGTKFRLDIHREFDASIPYMVSRVLTGYIEEVFTATDTIIITGDIEMDGMDVGFFKMISAPSDIADSLEHLDQQVEKRKS